jgi:hypothetical protein
MRLVNMHDVLIVASPLRTKPPVKHAVVLRRVHTLHVWARWLPACTRTSYASDACLLARMSLVRTSQCRPTSVELA